jgi:glycine cleavage system protein P-like pyridoxal-binding family
MIHELEDYLCTITGFDACTSYNPIVVLKENMQDY